MLYGATGYTGELIAAEAVRRGHRPLLAGRSEAKLRPLAERLGLPFRAVALDDAAGLRAAIDGLRAVMHCAGPFVETSPPMRAACLDAGASYLDITGELKVFSDCYASDAEAMRRGVALMPGVGFDVVPTDCLAAHLAGQVSQPIELEIAIAAIAQPSSGTAKSALGIFTMGGRVRRDGQLKPWPFAKGIKRVKFSQREAWVMPFPLGDLEAAWRSTKIPNITCYFAIPSKAARLMKPIWPLQAASAWVGAKALEVGFIRRFTERSLEKRMKAPDAEGRAKGHSFIWAKVTGAGGSVAEGRMDTVEGYAFTEVSAVLAVEEMLKRAPVGACSPAEAFGADFAMRVPGTSRT